MPVAPISVVIPAFNAERFIREAIESVQAQTTEVSEIIVVDNNSTDRTSQIALETGAIVINQEKQGLSAARNKGIFACDNPWVALLDADDCWDERKIEYQWEAIKLYPDVGMVACKFLTFKDIESLKNSKRNDINRAGEINIQKHCEYFPKVEINDFLRSGILPSSVVLNREIFSSIGFFDERFMYHQDAEYFSRVLSRRGLVVIDELLMNYRRHGNNRSNDKKEMAETLVRIVEKMSRFPENYLPGAREHYLNRLKMSFVQKGRQLTREKEIYQLKKI